MGKRIQTKEQRQKQIISRLRNENKKLREKIKIQEVRINELENLVEKLQLQIEELQRIIFGSGKKDRKNQGNDDVQSSIKQSTRQIRPSKSYRRATPPAEEITDTKYETLNQCPDCANCLSDIKEVVRYTEDILPIKKWPEVLKQVTKQIIETGYCPECNKRVTAKKIAPQTVILGENIKQFIAFATIILRLSYEQIKDFLESTTGIKLSDGEISNILERQAGQLEPAFERLKDNIRGQPGAHYDETGWKVQTGGQGNHAWVMSGAETTDTVFLVGRSRGKDNIDELRGENNAEQIGISDDYNAYKNVFEVHALCWAHPHRKLRDLKNSDTLSMEKREHCKNVYESFAELYADVQEIAVIPFNNKQRLRAKNKLMLRLDAITQPHPLDPLKLRQIKNRLFEQKECYFVCITHEGIPPDNNKAERALRHLVLKRKNSYGSKTQVGADRMSVLYSVLLSAWWKSKQTFFQDYSTALNG